MSEILAIANCRVSSNEQLKNGSLGRQKTSVELAAAELKADLIKVWSGDVSSKKGLNVDRKDLEEMLALCKKEKRIKFVIIDELDRFMRSMLEIGYFLVLFNNLGVKVVFASQPSLKTDTAADTLMLMLEAFKAEGSNEERIRKSISGQTTALQEGRYTFRPKPGYMKGHLKGVHVVHQDRGPALRLVLKRMALGLVDPTDALIELNNSDFTKDHSPYKMDKFRKIVTDPYYAGVVEINKQVKVYNEHGEHEALITLDEHHRLLEIMSKKPKYQTGPLRKGNPLFPLNNFVEHHDCVQSKDKGRFVGFPHDNGKTSKVYYRYKCRSCNKLWLRDDVHPKIIDLFQRYEMSEDTTNKIIDALDVVWRRDNENRLQKMESLKRSVVKLESAIEDRVESATDPSNSQIKDDLLRLIDKKKSELLSLKNQLKTLVVAEDEDREEFMKFAVDFILQTGRNFLDPRVSKVNRIRCKQMLFPGGIVMGKNDKVYTPEASIFYRLAKNKKDLSLVEKSFLVQDS